MENKRLRLAILDMYDNTPNQGMRAIQNIVRQYEKEYDWQIFDVRAKCELPDTNWDIYISSGGPGDPLEGDGIWDEQYYKLIDELWWHNRQENVVSKHVFFICHSFQMICHHFGLAEVLPRNSRSFGTFPVHMTAAGNEDPFFQPLPDPFYVADFRDYQVIQPNRKVFRSMGARILAREKIRPHVPLERAVMAIRFSDTIFGTQFHPEADPEGMLNYFTQPAKKQEIVEQHGLKKFERMVEDLNDDQKIPLTYQTILPTFLVSAIQSLKAGQTVTV